MATTNPFDPFLSAPGVTLKPTPVYTAPNGIPVEHIEVSLFDPSITPAPYVGGFLSQTVPVVVTPTPTPSA